MSPASTAFLDPRGANLAEVRQLVHRIVDLTLDARVRAGSRAASRHRSTPVPADLPGEARSDDEIVADLTQLIAASAQPSHPDFLAHMGAVSSVMSPVGDFVAACLNNNLIALELSPALSLLEEDVARRLAASFGLGPAAGGVVTTGGSLSNLHALVVARNRVLGTREQGVHGLDGAPVLLASEAAHASITKGAMIAGLGATGAIAVRTDLEGRLDMADLRAAYTAAVDAGQRPFAVVATAGTTVTGSIDPIAEAGAFARERGLWFHVDAAWGGGLQLCPRLRSRLEGIERADSITFCPQKLLLVGLSSSVVLFRDMDAMERSFRTAFPYVDQRESFVNRCEIGVQGSRPAEVLKLWLTLRHVGMDRHAELIEQWVRLAEEIATEVDRRPFLHLACRPSSGIVCFRAATDARTSDLHAAIARDAGVRLSLVPFRGPLWLRAVCANPYIEERVVERIFAVVDAHAAATALSPPTMK